MATCKRFENAFAMLVGTWTETLSRDTSLIVAQYRGLVVTVHYCNRACKYHQDSGIECIGIDDYYGKHCQCTPPLYEQYYLTDQIMHSLLTEHTSLIDLTTTNSVLKTSDYLLDFIILELTKTAFANAAYRIASGHSRHTHIIQDVSYIVDILQYDTSVINELFARRRDELANIIKLPSDNLALWRKCTSLFEYYIRITT
ncbi:MAG: hypothetical protein Faunusvirus8_26 [Faunusvirus sp.]|jgi:hypothetical protein|uniref:Uncharacterized protein n=1 Tax=Faunusvirus sp. TaxID=2487766 RepID=A0A3G5A1D3_9VIRU|nr:MAG: hypothetical protein Faunusvirus8_26 [Faunusvirus sp.]